MQYFGVSKLYFLEISVLYCFLKNANIKCLLVVFYGLIFVTHK